MSLKYEPASEPLHIRNPGRLCVAGSERKNRRTHRLPGAFWSNLLVKHVLVKRCFDQCNNRGSESDSGEIGEEEAVIKRLCLPAQPAAVSPALNTDEFIPHEAGSPFGWIEPEIAQYLGGPRFVHARRVQGWAFVRGRYFFFFITLEPRVE